MNEEISLNLGTLYKTNKQIILEIVAISEINEELKKLPD